MFIQTGSNDDPFESLESLANEALKCSKTARRNRVSLSGANHYARKLSALRTEATVQARRITPREAGGGGRQLDTTLDQIFSPRTDYPTRSHAQTALNHLRRTVSWSIAGEIAPTFTDGVIPLELLEATNRGYLVAVGKQINGCFHSSWFDACSVMMRRLLETAIVELFEAHQMSAKIKRNGNFVTLADLITMTLSEATWNLSRNTRTALPKLKELGDLSAHSRTFTGRRSDVDAIQMPFRVAVEELLHYAKLLPTV